MSLVLQPAEIAVRIGKSVAYVSNSLQSSCHFRMLSKMDFFRGLLVKVMQGHWRQLMTANLMIEAYKIILRESGSVRRAEELARRMKVKSQQETKRPDEHVRIVSDEIDKMQADMENALENTVEGDGSLRNNSVN